MIYVILISHLSCHVKCLHFSVLYCMSVLNYWSSPMLLQNLEPTIQILMIIKPRKQLLLPLLQQKLSASIISQKEGFLILYMSPKLSSICAPVFFALNILSLLMIITGKMSEQFTHLTSIIQSIRSPSWFQQAPFIHLLPTWITLSRNSSAMLRICSTFLSTFSTLWRLLFCRNEFSERSSPPAYSFAKCNDFLH